MRAERRLTVLHISQPVDGGVARVVTDLVRSQCESDARVIVACPPGGILGEAAAAAGAEVLPWAAGREPGVRLAHETAQLTRIIGRTGPDLVHAHSAKAGLAGRLAVRGRTPTVYQPHAWSFEAVSGPTAELALRWERFAARWASCVLCVSQAERQRGRHAGVPGSYTVIHNGVDTVRFRPVSADARRRARSRLSALYGIPRSAPLVACVGRLCRQKGQDVLLRAWPQVAAEIPGARLVFVGDGPDAGDLRRAAPEQVVFAGQTGDPAAWYAAADLVASPSRWEGMALSPLEAMACGRPVVLSDVSGARESLPAHHVPACLVPPDDPKALAAALSCLLADTGLREALGNQAREHTGECFDVRRTAAAVSQLYGELLGLSAVPQPAPHTERRDRTGR